MLNIYQGRMSPIRTRALELDEMPRIVAIMSTRPKWRVKAGFDGSRGSREPTAICWINSEEPPATNVMTAYGRIGRKRARMLFEVLDVFVHCVGSDHVGLRFVRRFPCETRNRRRSNPQDL